MDQDEHIAVSQVWNYTCGTATLSEDQTRHIYECPACSALLGLCGVCRSLEEVEAELKKRRQKNH
jgi:hypothetical protein